MFEKITPEAAGISSSEIKRYIDYLNDNSYSIHSLLMLRDGNLFTEAYWKPFNKDFCHRQYSQTKSFVGIAIGLLVSDGAFALQRCPPDTRTLPPQPTMRTDLDIGARNPVTTMVTGFFVPFFQVKLGRYPKPKTAFGEDLN